MKLQHEFLMDPHLMKKVSLNEYFFGLWTSSVSKEKRTNNIDVAAKAKAPGRTFVKKLY